MEDMEEIGEEGKGWTRSKNIIYIYMEFSTNKKKEL